MDDFLKVINGIDWDMLHDQKLEMVQILLDNEKVFGATSKMKMEGVVNLIDDLQDVAAKLRMWEFPGEYDGNCPDCNGRNYEFLEDDEYECYDCGELFTIKRSDYDGRNYEFLDRFIRKENK